MMPSQEHRQMPARPPSIGVRAALAVALAPQGDAPALLHAAARAVAEQCGVALARIWVLRSGILTLEAGAGLNPKDDERARVPVGQFTVGHIARTRLPLLVDSIVDHPHIHDKEWSRREGIVAFAGFPLVVDKELQGVLALFDTRPIPPSVFLNLVDASTDLALAFKRFRVNEPASFPLPASEPHAGTNGIHHEHAVIVTSLDGTITDWNQGAELLFGYQRDEAIGQSLMMLVPPELAEEHCGLLARVRQNGRMRGEATHETTRLHKSGERISVRLSFWAMRDAAGLPAGAVTVCHDLADLKRLEQQLCLAQKMEIYGQLAGGVAHDFNNLITIILGYSEIALSRLPAADPQREFLAEIRKAGERGENLTRQLLAFSRKKVLEPKSLDLNAVVADTEKMLRRLIGEDILMTTVFAPKLARVLIDPGQIQQIILNLAINARDAMPRGGRLTIETANVVLDDAYPLTHRDIAPGCYVLFAMSDTGLGMQPHVKARIFEPLFTTKGPGKGTGLGLTTVQSIVRQARGHIEVYSEIGHGSTFKIYLPRADDSIDLAKSSPRLRTIPRGQETILLAEDEDSVRALARHVLELSGYKILEASNGAQALSLAQAHCGPIDLLLTDVVMPHLGGRPLAERLLQVKPKLKVLFLSGYTNEAVVRHGVLDSDYAFLQKPFTTGALALKVREVLDQPPIAVPN